MMHSHMYHIFHVCIHQAVCSVQYRLRLKHRTWHNRTPQLGEIKLTVGLMHELTNEQ